jgi:hypothetical protein
MPLFGNFWFCATSDRPAAPGPQPGPQLEPERLALEQVPEPQLPQGLELL